MLYSNHSTIFEFDVLASEGNVFLEAFSNFQLMLRLSNNFKAQRLPQVVQLATGLKQDYPVSELLLLQGLVESDYPGCVVLPVSGDLVLLPSDASSNILRYQVTAKSGAISYTTLTAPSSVAELLKGAQLSHLIVAQHPGNVYTIIGQKK